MALPRPVLIAVLGIALIGAAFLATRGAHDTGAAVSSQDVASQPQPHPAATPRHAAAKPASRGQHAAAKPTGGQAKHATHAAAPAKPSHAQPKPAVSPQVAAARRVLPVVKALGRGDVVVFFFTQPGAADDTGAREAVKSLHGQKHVTVVQAQMSDLETFRPVLASAKVSQVPSIVVVHAGRARLIEGYVDAGTLRQTVADARA